MSYFNDSASAAANLITSLDARVFTIAATSLKISLYATFAASIVAVFLGIFCAINNFPGKKTLQHLLNTLMAMPTVMIGLILYGLLSRKGIFGDFGLLYTQTAVIIGESLLIFPIIMNMSLVAVQSSDSRLLLTLKMLGANHWQIIVPVISELRYVLLAAVITGFGRAIGEVGAAMMLGGNIQGTTRTMTTAIALETSKGDFELGLALGFILLFIAFSVNIILQLLTAQPKK